MKINVRNIDTELDKLIAKLETARDKITISKAAELTKRLSEATPVDTGFAKSSWNIDYNKRSKNVKIRNDTPYIDELNHGTSKQAPAFFVEKIALQFGKPVGSIVKYSPDK